MSNKIKKTFLILIDGPMGSGKTTTSKLLNQRLPDTARVALPDIKRLVPNFRENPETLTIVREVMHAMIETYLEHGVSVVVELITKSEGVAPLERLAEKYSSDFYAYRLTAPRETRWDRVQKRTQEMMQITTLPQSKIYELSGYFEPNNQFYIENPVDVSETIDTEQHSPEQVVEMIVKKLENVTSCS